MIRHQDIFPVIVIYKCRLQEALSYQTLLASGDFPAFMVYDNSPADYVASPEEMPKGAVYVHDENNGGLSRAYNRAAEYAVRNGYERLLLLDQDTWFPPEASQIYLTADSGVTLWTPQVRTTSGADFSPCYVGGWCVKGVCLSPGIYDLHQYESINSGLCVTLKAFHAAGGYNDAVRLDFADFQFQNRLRQVDSRLLVLPFIAVQDFSNEQRDASVLYTRFKLYLESASHCRFHSTREKLTHHLAVVRHTLALSLRTRKICFLTTYFTHYLFKKS